MRKEKETFKPIYEGNNNSYSVNNLSENTNYEFRIYSLYNDITSAESQIHKIKTIDFDCDSNILNESKRKDKYLKKIYEWIQFKKMELLYRATRDGMTEQCFHNKCDNKGETICLYKNEKGNIFGGYASIPWTNDGSFHSAPDSFLFTLTNIHNIEPTKFFSKNDQKEVNHKHGPTFGYGTDLYIDDNFGQNNCQTYFPYTYQDTTGKGKTIFTGDFNINNSYFKVIEIEVFKLYK